MELKISQNYSVDPNEIVTKRTCLIGQSGSGKSYAVAVICEELLKNEIGFCIIDTEGEYFSLKSKFKIVWIGNDERCDLNIEEVDLEDLGKKVARDRIPIIFDVSETENPKEKIEKFLESLYEEESKVRSPYLIILEEADRFVPQRGEKLKIIEEIAKRGRKRGIGLLIATQRPSIVDKNILSQCGNQIIGKLTIENDIKAVSIFFEDRKLLLELPRLNPGEFFFNGKLIKFRRRETKHEAITPKVIPWKFEKLKVEKKKVIGVKPKDIEGELFFVPITEYKVSTIKHTILGDQIEKFTIYVYDSKFVKLSPLKVLFDFSRIKDLGEKEIFILNKMKNGDTIEDLEKYFSETTLRKILKDLEKEGLITSEKKTRKRYFKLIKINLSLKKISSKEVEKEEVKWKERKVKFFENVIKGIDPIANIESKQVIYYPIYKVKRRILGKEFIKFLDGVSGRSLSWSPS